MTRNPEPAASRRKFNGPWFVLLFSLVLSGPLAGCAKPQAAVPEKPQPPATVKNAPKESDLSTITLTPQAEQRLGIQYATAAIRKVARTHTFGADVVLPPDRTTVLAAPIGGTLSESENPPPAGTVVRKGQTLYRLTPYVAPERDFRLQLEREVAAAETRLEAAKVRFNRAAQLLRDKATSEKAVQQAREEQDLAENDLRAARARLERFISSPLAGDTPVVIASPREGIIQRVLANPGQSVSAGTPLLEIVDTSAVWIRVPIYVGEVPNVNTGQAARIHNLADPPGTAGRLAHPVGAPPTADPTSSTADFYYELANSLSGSNLLRPGQRVSATVSLRGREESMAVPWSAILHDANGGTWVYENIAPQTFTRRRVEVSGVVETLALLSHGPAVGARIVAVGAAELFGTEFGAGK